MGDCTGLDGELRQLEMDVQWRRNEISYLRKQEALTRFDPLGSTGNYRNRIYLRLLVAALYAHHEGYAIRCWDSIYSEIDASGATPAALRRELQLLIVEGELKKIRNASPLELLDICAGTSSLFPTTYSFVESRPVRSDGNLKPKPYCKAFRDLGIEVNLSIEDSSLLFQLVSLRNDVVHGRPLPDTIIDNFDQFAALVYKLQDRSFLATRSYLLGAEYLR